MMASDPPPLTTPLSQFPDWPFPAPPNFSALVALELAPLHDVQDTLLSAADQVVQASDTGLERDTAADLDALAAVVGAIPETAAEPDLDAVEEASAGAANELDARATELPAESVPPDQIIPPPEDEFTPEGAPVPPGEPPPDEFELVRRTIVRDWYLRVLAREPDPGGWAVWVSRLRAGESSDRVYRDFVIAANVERASRGLPPWPVP